MVILLSDRACQTKIELCLKNVAFHKHLGMDFIFYLLNPHCCRLTHFDVKKDLWSKHAN